MEQELVNTEDLERELSRIRAAAAGAQSGVFGSGSLTWHVDREAAIFLGAGRALLLQLAHPWVAAAIEQHSNALADPIGRFHRTFSTVFSMVFGSLDQSFGAARRLHRRHSMITGQLPSAAGPFPAGLTYCANAIPALTWVHATLVDTAVIAYELLLPPLNIEQRERYYRESRIFAGLFGIPDETLPRDWTAFSAYTTAMMHSETLTVTDRARTIGRQLIGGMESWVLVPSVYQALTAALLPRRIREAFGFSFKAADLQAARQFITRLRPVYLHMPARIRYVGPYQEAQQRLAGRPRTDFLTRLCNRVWIGRSELPREV
jgi:uncharacterized protein (DUF2236 family)